MLRQISIKTRVGWISAFENEGKIFKIKFGRLKKQKKGKILEVFKKELLKFFDRKILNLNVPAKMHGNKIQIRIWNELKKIKPGNTKSYGWIAKKHKLSARHIGKICGQNKLMLLVPCHRVIRSNGDIGGFSSSGGIQLKKKLLEFEENFN